MDAVSVHEMYVHAKLMITRRVRRQFALPHISRTDISGHKNESFEALLLPYENCAQQLSLTPKQISTRFPNALEGIALDFFHTHLSMNTPFSKIVQAMSRQFNS